MLIVANWKMYLTLRQSEALAERFARLEIRDSRLEVVVCPSFVALEEVAEEVSESKGRWLKIGAQDASWAEKGAYTGEVSAEDLKKLGCRYVIVGHSERRQYFGESDAMVAHKVAAVAKAGMTPILCVGETWAERRGSRAERKVIGQLTATIKKSKISNLKSKIVVAYEPVWAIGTGKTVEPEEATRMHGVIRSTIAKMGWLPKTPILYGGSVNQKNVSAFLSAPEVDGVLIGGASTQWLSLKKIIVIAKNISR